MTPPPRPLRRLPGRLAVTVLATLALTLTVGVPLAAPAQAAVPSPRVPTGLPVGIEAPAAYVAANSCDFTIKPGTLKLAQLLKSTYPQTSYGISRTCGPVPNSEHLEGRAVDWMISVRSRTQAAQANAVLKWLIATDRAGNVQANARRLGVMYLIWDNKILSLRSAGAGWRPYRDCATRPDRSDDGYCHRNHIHISLSWEGAMGRTSYWSKRVAKPDYGPCRAADLNWAAPTTRVNPVLCKRYPRVVAPAGASSLRKNLTTYSGMVLRSGSKGNAVKAVQQVVRATADGDFGPRTKAAVQRWQASRDISPSGVVNATTWRAMLKAVR